MPNHKPTKSFIYFSTSLSQLPRNPHPPTISTKVSSHPLNNTILYPQTYRLQPTVFDPYLTKYVRIAPAPHTYSTKLISLLESARRRRRYFFHFCSLDLLFFPTQKRLVNYKRRCRG